MFQNEVLEHDFENYHDAQEIGPISQWIIVISRVVVEFLFMLMISC